jgi:phosphate:Na+ symporter
LDLEKEVDQLEIRYKKHHIERLEKGVCNQTAGIIFVEVLRNLERIGDHAVNIAGDTLAIHQ